MRSRRPMVTLGAAAFGCAALFAFLANEALELPGGWVAAIALGAGSAGGCAVAIWACVQLRAWPTGRLGLFRDRLVVVQGRHEMRAVWALMDTVTLADATAWPRIKITDRLTINFRNEGPMRFKPAHFGLEAAACRDMILRLRDEAPLRARLPEFDSARDLVATPVVAGELFEPRL